MIQPLISIITPVYNAEKSIQNGIDSVLSQTYGNWELILVDDGSTDGSGALLDKAAAKDSRITVIHKANGGVSSARNVGLQAARGEYIAWMDSDDYFCPEALEKLYAAISAHGLPIAICNYKNVFPDGSSGVRYAFTDADRVYPRETVMGMILGIAVTPVVWANLMHRSLWEGVVFPEGKLFEDVQTTYKIYEKSPGAVFIAEPLFIRVQHLDSLSRIPNLKNRVEGSLYYIDRFNDAVQRWPMYRKSMLVSSAHTLIILQKNVLSNSSAAYKTCSEDIRKICRFYRSHFRDIIPKGASLPCKAEFFFITMGTRTGFILSRALVRLSGRKHGWLKNIPTPDLPRL
ncbi:MAG: glycosyltransferase family 2 protein [Clostridia bacterium]|nr:glycosyltransferase family 2 protein [Clostridia bacterium]